MLTFDVVLFTYSEEMLTWIHLLEVLKWKTNLQSLWEIAICVIKNNERNYWEMIYRYGTFLVVSRVFHFGFC